MKAKIFYSIEEFNKWAKGKALTKDIIIHTIVWARQHGDDSGFAIVVYHPEDPIYDQTEPELTTLEGRSPKAKKSIVEEIATI